MVRVGVVVLVGVMLAWCAVAEAATRPAFAQVPGSFAVTVKSAESASVLNVVFNGRSERIRLIGVSVPECIAYEASRRVSGLTYGRVAFLERDTSQRDYDDAIPGYLWLDDVMVNLRLVGEGYALAEGDGVNSRYDAELRSAAARARGRGVGLWSQADC